MRLVLLLQLAAAVEARRQRKGSATSAGGDAPAEPTSSAEDSGDGGWSGAEDERLMEGSERCTIPRVDPSKLSAAELADRFGPEGSKVPAIIVSGGAFPPHGDASWAANWSKASLLERSRGKRLHIGSSEQIGFSGVAVEAEPVEDLLARDEMDWVAFDREFLLKSTSTQFVPEPPDWLAAAVEGYEHILSLGGPGAGLTFHNHGALYNIIAFGAKRWFLHPPKWQAGPAWRSLASTRISSQDYLLNVHAHLPDEDSPLECMQRPGEVVFVPKGWQHATVNTKQTLGLLAQVSSGQLQKEREGVEKVAALRASRTELEQQGGAGESREWATTSWELATTLYTHGSFPESADILRDLVDATEHLITIRERETHQARRSRIVDATKRILAGAGDDGEVQEQEAEEEEEGEPWQVEELQINGAMYQYYLGMSLTQARKPGAMEAISKALSDGFQPLKSGELDLAAVASAVAFTSREREQGCDIAAIVSKGHAADPAFKLEKPRVSRLLELYCETAPERIMRLKPDREELRVMAGKLEAALTKHDMVGAGAGFVVPAVYLSHLYQWTDKRQAATILQLAIGAGQSVEEMIAACEETARGPGRILRDETVGGWCNWHVAEAHFLLSNIFGQGSEDAAQLRAAQTLMERAIEAQSHPRMVELLEGIRARREKAEANAPPSPPQEQQQRQQRPAKEGSSGGGEQAASRSKRRADSYGEEEIETIDMEDL